MNEDTCRYCGADMPDVRTAGKSVTCAGCGVTYKAVATHGIHGSAVEVFDNGPPEHERQTGE